MTMFLAVPDKLHARRTISADVSLNRSRVISGKDVLGEGRCLDLLAWDQRVEVGHDDRRRLEPVQLFRRPDLRGGGC
jgi:hypothetical protein